MKRIYILGLMAIGIFLTACNMPNEEVEDIFSENRVLTAAAQTVEAILTENPTDNLEETPVPTLSIPTQAATKTSVPGPKLTLTALSLSETPENSIPCNLATFITDVTVDDGDDFGPGEVFTKTWRLKNIGSCSWTTGYEIVFFDGFSMSGPASRQISDSEVAPGEEIDISVELTAPAPKGSYKGYWKLRTTEGILFSLNNNKAFWVEIDVIP